MQKVLEDIFFLKNVDGSSFMIMRGMDDEVDYQNGVARLFHPYVGKSFNYYFSLELEEDKINNSYMVYIVDTDIERIDINTLCLGDWIITFVFFLQIL